jgi:hypothetical protein
MPDRFALRHASLKMTGQLRVADPLALYGIPCAVIPSRPATWARAPNEQGRA